MVKKYIDLLLDTRKALLQQEDMEIADMMAKHLVAHISKKSVPALLADRDAYATDEICKAVQKGLDRLLEGEPLAYVLGHWEFYGLPFKVTPDVLIPRDDTCAVASLAINRGLFLSQDPRILDLCCGSGCIGIAVASRVKDARVTLADISRDALAVAKNNIALNKLTGRVYCVSADAMQPAHPFLGKFDMIVSNPPYITGEEMKVLPKSVSEFEPHLALYGGEDGLDFYRFIISHWTPALKSTGAMVLEVGIHQADAVEQLLSEQFEQVYIVPDLNNIPRVLLGVTRK